MALGLIVFLGNMNTPITEASDYSFFSQKQSKQDSEFLPSYLVKQELKQMNLIRLKNELMNNASQGANDSSLDTRLRSKQTFVEDPHYQANASPPSTDTESVITPETVENQVTPEETVTNPVDTVQFGIIFDESLGSDEIPERIELIKKAADAQGYGKVIDWSRFNETNTSWSTYTSPASGNSRPNNFGIFIQTTNVETQYSDIFSLSGIFESGTSPTVSFSNIHINSSGRGPLSKDRYRPTDMNIYGGRVSYNFNIEGISINDDLERQALFQTLADQAGEYGDFLDWQSLLDRNPAAYSIGPFADLETRTFTLRARTVYSIGGVIDDFYYDYRVLQGEINTDTGVVTWGNSLMQTNSVAIRDPSSLPSIDFSPVTTLQAGSPDTDFSAAEASSESSSLQDNADEGNDLLNDFSLKESPNTSPSTLSTLNSPSGNFFKNKRPVDTAFYTSKAIYHPLEPLRVLVDIIQNFYRPALSEAIEGDENFTTRHNLFKAIEFLSDILNMLMRPDFSLIQSLFDSFKDDEDEAQKHFLLSIRPYYEKLMGSEAFQRLVNILGLKLPSELPLDPEDVTEDELSLRDAVYEAYLMLTESKEILSQEESSQLLRELVRLEGQLYREYILPAQTEYERNAHQTLWEILAQIFNDALQREDVFVQNQKDGSSVMLINLVPVT